MIKNGILSIVFATLLMCGVVPHANAYQFILDSLSITSWSGGPGLDIATDSSPYLSSPIIIDLSPEQTSAPFSIFDIWTTESDVALGEDNIPRDISVEFSFSNLVTTGTITGQTVGYAEESTFYGVTFPDINDEGRVTWGPSANFTFGVGDSGMFSISLLPTLPFNRDVLKDLDGHWLNLDYGQIYGSTVEATLYYEKAPSAVPVPPAIILLGTGILGIAGIRRKYKK